MIWVEFGLIFVRTVRLCLSNTSAPLAFFLPTHIERRGCISFEAGENSKASWNIHDHSRVQYDVVQMNTRNNINATAWSITWDPHNERRLFLRLRNTILEKHQRINWKTKSSLFRTEDRGNYIFLRVHKLRQLVWSIQSFSRRPTLAINLQHFSTFPRYAVHFYYHANRIPKH